MGFTHLAALAVALAVATLLASFLPLHISLSPKAVTRTSTYATGLLCGAALSIVIPEGVTAIFENSGGGDDGSSTGVEVAHEANSGWIGAALLAGFLLMYLVDSLHGHDEYPDPTPRSPHGHHHHHHQHRHNRPRYHQTPSREAELEPLANGGGNSFSRDSSPERVGGKPQDDHELRWEETGGDSSASSRCRSPCPFGDDPNLIKADASSISTVIGLLAHSLADGVSLGASSLPTSSSSVADSPSSSSSLQLVVFVAIMLHKAPTAFALSSILSSSPATSRAFVRRALIIFSLAAPLGALATYTLLSLLSTHAAGSSNTGWWTGLALVFSGGTFLFVATHVVREQEKKHERAEGEPGAMRDDERIGDKVRVALVVGGMVTPAILGRFVGHGH
ncbi:zipmetalion transporter [Rhodotorula toruloides]|uniref:Zipmetalion transporter n=1 Tax=Rhodotorula toruloides TaxID=5286 RepID=A0A511KB22_RHOTO|nr:zipmetalion transporter [Rhodotorula toruloides]